MGSGRGQRPRSAHKNKGVESGGVNAPRVVFMVHQLFIAIDMGTPGATSVSDNSARRLRPVTDKKNVLPPTFPTLELAELA